ncbi:hypothetical protein CON22_24875 [Bacillus cereus]|nr:hypothetical protein CON22_24875 [Bacillus cereus]
MDWESVLILTKQAYNGVYIKIWDMYNPEECANEIDFTTMSTTNLIFISIKYELNYSTEEQIEILLKFFDTSRSLLITI